MNIGIIGAGFTGLTSAYRLLLRGHSVTLIEKDARPGGLAVGFKKPEWEWSLEEHYHHWFANDGDVLRLADALGYPVLSRRPKTSVYVNGSIFQLDSPFSLMRFPLLSIPERVRMAVTLGLLRYNPVWKPLEKINAHTALFAVMGEKPYELLWKPQLSNKFGTYYDQISLAWFWARVRKRTPELHYPEKGYLFFATSLLKVIKNLGGVVRFNTEVQEIVSNNKKPGIQYWRSSETFDALLVTLPNSMFGRLSSQLPISYQTKLNSFSGLGAVNMILRLKKQFLVDGTYWLSICDPTSPVMAVVEHTNFMDPIHYNNEHIVYAGNYVSIEDKRYQMSDRNLFNLYRPLLNRLNPLFESELLGYDVFRAPFAQPIITTGYSKKILPCTTPLPNVYLANMQQVYPWDRGTNYAVELGERVADVIMKEVLNHQNIKSLKH